MSDEPKTDWTPTRKVTAGMIGGAVATLVCVFLPSFGVVVPPGAEAAIGTLVTVAAAYIIRDSE